jgi:hypothetical protein
MADSKDDTPTSPPTSLPAGPSAVADIFNSVSNWSLETLGAPGRASSDPFARPSPQPLASWSLAGAELLEQVSDQTAALPPPAEPAGPSAAELYSAHEKSYDDAGRENPFVDPCSFALAVRGAPELEASRSNTTSISAASYAKMNLSSDKGGVSIASSTIPNVASLGPSDAILSGGASLAQNSDRQAVDKKLVAAWAKLWRY